MPIDLVFEALTLWLICSGALMIALAAWRFRHRGAHASTLLLVSAALLGWVGIVRLTTNLLGPEMAPIELGLLFRLGAPLIGSLAAVAVASFVLAALANRSAKELAAFLVLCTVVPLVGLAGIFTDPLP